MDGVHGQAYQCKSNVSAHTATTLCAAGCSGVANVERGGSITGVRADTCPARRGYSHAKCASTNEPPSRCSIRSVEVCDSRAETKTNDSHSFSGEVEPSKHSSLPESMDGVHRQKHSRKSNMPARTVTFLCAASGGGVANVERGDSITGVRADTRPASRGHGYAEHSSTNEPPSWRSI